MQGTFSPQLIARAVQIFTERSGRVVSEGEAKIYLEKLAQVGLMMERVMQTEREKNKKI